MSDDSAFIRAILANPDDAELRLIYADWLEERGDPRGEFLRLEAATARSIEANDFLAKHGRLQELRQTIDRGWLAQMGRSKIELCQVEFEFQCPKKWENLQVTHEEQVRFCDSCRQNVYYCHSIEEAQKHAVEDHCVAVDAGVSRRPGDLELVRGVTMGILGLPRLTQLRRGRQTRTRRD
jgi:uncharacterized protein (TIGR02996 family)